MSEQSHTTPQATEAAPMFSEPSEELVARATRELEYAERLTLHKMAAGIGSQALDVYSFERAVGVLFGTAWDRLLLDGSKAEIVWFEPATLVRWLRDIIGDAELADAAEEAMVGVEHLKGRTDAILPVFIERVAQYRRVIEETT